MIFPAALGRAAVGSQGVPTLDPSSKPAVRSPGKGVTTIRSAPQVPPRDHSAPISGALRRAGVGSQGWQPLDPEQQTGSREPWKGRQAGCRPFAQSHRYHSETTVHRLSPLRGWWLLQLVLIQGLAPLANDCRPFRARGHSTSCRLIAGSAANGYDDMG
jgi:hypothetical protein